MSGDDEREARGGGVMAGLLAPLRLPERAIRALEDLAEAAGNLGAMRDELRRVREQTTPLGDLLPALKSLEKNLGAPLRQVLEQTKPLAELLPALERVEKNLASRLDSMHETVDALQSDASSLNHTMTELARELAAMHKTLSGLKEDVTRITDRLPDPEEKRGPLKAARDVLTGNTE